MYDDLVAQKIARQYLQEPLRDFASVNPDTSLEDLNLNWREKDLPERERTKHVHRLHPYLGKFIPQLVEIFLRKYKPKLVYDPFCGSGTTLVEANALGIESIGSDISAFNVMLSKAKTGSYDVSLLEKEADDLLKKLCAHKVSSYKGMEDALKVDNEYINSWFAEDTRNDLMCFRNLIEKYTYQDLFKIILSRSARSARLVTHYDLDFPREPQTEPYHCFKHDRTCKPTEEAYKFLFRYTLDTLVRIKEFAKIRTRAPIAVHHADSREVELQKGIDLVFTSPPYVGLIDYHDQHKYAYQLLGLESKDASEIGPAKNGQSEQAKREYIEGINNVFLHTRDYMKKDGLMAVVVNDKHNLYNPEAIGFKSVGRVERHVNRRTGRREGAFYESILIWQKI